jgi:hypothetical protein
LRFDENRKTEDVRVRIAFLVVVESIAIENNDSVLRDEHAVVLVILGGVVWSAHPERRVYTLKLWVDLFLAKIHSSNESSLPP